MDDAALVVEVVQGLEHALQDDGEDRVRESSYWVAGKKRLHVFPKRRVDEALVLAVWA